MSQDMDALLVADTEARQAALAQESIIVEAPAGAGKTELLTQRFLALLPTVQDPEEIIALTFTNKAAAEMRARILESLALAASGQRPGEDMPHKQITYDLGRKVLKMDEDREWGLLQHPGRLQITTLDALCGKLARQMPFLSRFGSQPAVAPDAQPLYRQAARNTLDMLEDDGPQQEVLARVLEYFDNDARKLQSLLEDMLATRDQWLGHIHGSDGPSKEALAQLVDGELASIAAVLPPHLQQAIMATARYAGDMARQAGGMDNITSLIDWAEPLDGKENELARWRGLGELLLTKTGTLRSRFDPALKLSEKDVKPLAEALKSTIAALKDNAKSEVQLARITQLPDPLPTEEDWQLIADFTYLLTLASAQLWLVFMEQRQVDFIEVAQNALAALGSGEVPSELREKLDYRISHLLVDEFQDTSPTQVRLLEQLTADWSSGNGSEDGRTLFLVGDPMQSIYRFRKADVGLFLKVRDQGIGSIKLKALRLYRNNRSHRELVDWVNNTFPSVFAAHDDPRRGAVKFTPAAATKGSHEFAGVHIHPILAHNATEEDDETSGDQREAQKIIELLREARQRDPDGSIAVLVRARTHLQALVAALRQTGPELRYQAVEIEALDQRQSVQDLLALTRALHHRADRVNWLAILRAPWCGLTLADLHALAANDHRSTIWQLMQDEARVACLSEDGQQRLGHVRDVLTEAFVHQGQHRPRRWVEGVWQSLGGPLCLQSESDAVDVKAFFALLDGVESKGSLDLERLAEDMDKLYAAADPEGNAIQLMTIHKSKGLEFNTVILPGLHRTLRGGERNLLLWEQVLLDDGTGSATEHLIVAPLSRKKASKNAAPTCYDYLQEFEKQRSLHESQRILYVAATRAKQQLHLLGALVPSPKEDETCKAPASNSVLALLWPVVRAEFEAALPSQASGNQSFAQASEQHLFVPSLARLSSTAQPSALAIPSGTVKTDAGNESQEPSIEEHSLEVDVGILVHRYLDLIAREGLALWSEQRVERLSAAFQRWFQSKGHSVEDSRLSALAVRSHLLATLASESGRWLLADHQDAASEVSLTGQLEGTVRIQVIDRTFIEAGTHWIVDYKTSLPGGKDMSLFFDEQKAQYQNQLMGYATLLAAGDHPHPIRCALFFTGIGRLLHLD